MTAVLDKSRPYSKIMGSCPARAFQDGHHFDGAGNYLTWEQASGEAPVPSGAARAEKQSAQASLKAEISKAESPVPTAVPKVTSKTVVGQPTAVDAVAEALEAVNKEREAEGAPSVESVTAVEQGAIADRDLDQKAKEAKIAGYEERYAKAKALHYIKMHKICRKIVQDCVDQSLPIDQSYPKEGRGATELNAKFIAANTE